MPRAPSSLSPRTVSSGILASRSMRAARPSASSVSQNARNRARKASPRRTSSSAGIGCGWIRSSRKCPRKSSLAKLGLRQSCSRAASATCRASRSVTLGCAGCVADMRGLTSPPESVVPAYWPVLPVSRTLSGPPGKAGAVRVRENESGRRATAWRVSRRGAPAKEGEHPEKTARCERCSRTHGLLEPAKAPRRRTGPKRGKGDGRSPRTVGSGRRLLGRTRIRCRGRSGPGLARTCSRPSRSGHPRGPHPTA